MRKIVTNVVKRIFVFTVKHKDGAIKTVEIEAESIEAAKLKVPEECDIVGEPHELDVCLKTV